MEFYLIPATDEGKDDQWVLYRPLLGLAFVGNRSMAELAKKLVSAEAIPDPNDEAQRFLMNIGFLAPDPPPTQQKFILSTAVLLLTNQCQLRCTYCYAAAGDESPQSLSRQSDEAVIDFVYEQACTYHLDEFQLDFHGGGEPTLEWENLRAFTQYARAKPIKAKISVTSNAIWSEAQCRWLAENMDQISVSMDGSPVTQDRNRPLRNGRSSSSFVLRSLRLLDEYQATYGIRMTVRSPWQTLPEDVRYILENTGCRSIQVEPAFNLARGAHHPPQEEQYRDFVAAFCEAYLLARQHDARLTFSGTRPELITDIFCASPYAAVVVNPENQIVACYEITNARHPFAPIAVFGNVRGRQVTIDWQARQRFHELYQQRLETCKDCFCRWHCAGDCFTRAFSPGEGGHLAKNPRCAINQAITRFKLLDFIAMDGGVWRKFKPTEQGQYG